MMMKNKGGLLLLLSVLLLLTLSSCMLGAGDALVPEDIERVTAEILGDEIDVTVWYEDYDPTNFRIPLQSSGLRGETGNGIQRVDVARTAANEQTMTLYYTDLKMAPTSITLQDGVGIAEAERIDVEGDAYLRLRLSDGTQRDILLPRGNSGSSGEGIKQISYTTDPLSNVTTLNVQLTNDTVTSIPIYPGVGLTGEVISTPVTDAASGKRGVEIQFVMDKRDPANPDQKMLTGKIFVPSGEDGFSIDRVETLPYQPDGIKLGTQFRFVMNDEAESKTDYITVLDGVGIASVESVIDPDTQETTLKITMTDGSEKSVVIPPAEAVGIEAIEVVDSGNLTEYSLEITYTNGETKNVVFPQNTAWHHGSGAPASSLGKPGDYYFDTTNVIIYRKASEGVWDGIADLSSFRREVTVRFCIDRTQGERWSDGSDAAYKSLQGRVGTVTASSGYQIPIPQKTGYTFLGWYAVRNPNPAVDGCFTSLTVLPNTETLTLYPCWQAS